MKPKSDVLAYLLKGGKLTVQRAFRLFHTTELRKIVSRLRREGHDIRSNVRNDRSVDGRNVNYKEYYYSYEESTTP